MGALAQAYFAGFTVHWGAITGKAALDRAYATAQRALALDPTSPYAARALSLVYLFTHRRDDAVLVLEEAVKSNPSNDALLFRLGDTYTYAGQPERGVALLRQVYQLNPRYTGSGHAFIGRGLLLLGRREDAIAELKTCALRAPAFRVCHEVAAVAYAELGRLDEARAEAAEAHRLDPEFTLASAPEVLPFKNPQGGSQASIDRSSSIPRSSAKRANSAIEASTMRTARETTQVRRRNRASQCRWREWSRSMPCVSSLPTNSRPCGISSA
jgi:adenylate cyclase